MGSKSLDQSQLRRPLAPQGESDVRQQRLSQPEEITVLVIVHLDDPPRVPTPADRFSVDHDVFLRTDERKGHEVLHGRKVCGLERGYAGERRGEVWRTLSSELSTIVSSSSSSSSYGKLYTGIL